MERIADNENIQYAEFRSAEKKVSGFRLMGIILVLLWPASCSPSPGVKVAEDPDMKDFYEKARLIMTGEESKIWKSLPDNASREEFIEEFWKIRDPDPATDETKANRGV